MSMRRTYLFAAAMCVLFFGSATLVVIGVNTGHIHLVRYVAVRVGIATLIGQLAFIVYMLRRPPFRTR